jgi:hypothetical protein
MEVVAENFAEGDKGHQPEALRQAQADAATGYRMTRGHSPQPQDDGGFMMTAPGPMLWARLPAGGWQVGFWVDADGRTLVDVADSWGSLAYRLASARRAAPSIDAAWAGRALRPAGDSQCWALAMGHAPTGLSHVVSFVRLACGAGRDQVMLPPETLSGFWVADDGLWVAAAIGSYTHVRLTAQSAALLYPLRQVAG